MEQFFTPTQFQRLPDWSDFAEVQLDVSIEAFMNHSWDWSDLYAFTAGDEGEMWKCLWITEDTLMWFEDDNNYVDFDRLKDYAFLRASLAAKSGEVYNLILAKKNMDSPSSLPGGAFNIFWHAVTTSNCVELLLEDWSSYYCIEPCSSPALLQFMEASPSLEILQFVNFRFEEAHCRNFATLKRTDLEFTFKKCSFDARDALDAFIEWFRQAKS
jgi:hypothetical protein